MKSLGKRITEIRGKHSRRVFAAGINVAERSIVHYERDEREPPHSVLARIVEIYGVDAQWLLTGVASVGAKAGAGSNLTEEEKFLVENFRKASLVNRNACMTMLSADLVHHQPIHIVQTTKNGNNKVSIKK